MLKALIILILALVPSIALGQDLPSQLLTLEKQIESVPGFDGAFIKICVGEDCASVDKTASNFIVHKERPRILWGECGEVEIIEAVGTLVEMTAYQLDYWGFATVGYAKTLPDGTLTEIIVDLNVGG